MGTGEKGSLIRSRPRPRGAAVSLVGGCAVRSGLAGAAEAGAVTVGATASAEPPPGPAGRDRREVAGANARAVAEAIAAAGCKFRPLSKRIDGGR
jgi:hypothetical protein